MKSISKNQFDKKDSLEIGQQAENLFVHLAKAQGYTVQYANSLQDIDEHWDYEIAKEAESYKVDVKGRKRVSRNDASPQDIWIWVEIHGVRPKDQGWLYGGKSELIAFERASDFVIVKTEDLKQLIPKLLEKETDIDANVENKKVNYKWVASASEAQYKLYRRKGRKDILTLIQFTDLQEIIWEIWKK